MIWSQLISVDWLTWLGILWFQVNLSQWIDWLDWAFYDLKSTYLWELIDLIRNFMIWSQLIPVDWLTWLGILWFEVNLSLGIDWLDRTFYDLKSTYPSGLIDLIGYFVISSQTNSRKGLTWLEILWFQVISSREISWLDSEMYRFPRKQVISKSPTHCLLPFYN